MKVKLEGSDSPPFEGGRADAQVPAGGGGSGLIKQNVNQSSI